MKSYDPSEWDLEPEGYDPDEWDIAGVETPSAMAAPEPEDDSWNITKGFQSGGWSTAAVVPAVGAMGAKAIGWKGGAQAMSEAAQGLMAKAEQYKPDTSFGELIKDPSLGGAVDWAMFTIGNFAPSMVVGFGGAGAGAKVATKLYLKNAIKKGVERGLTKEAAAQLVTKEVKRKIATKGAQVGIVGTTAPMEGGHMFMGDVERHGIEDASVIKGVIGGGLAGLVELGIGGFGKGHFHLIEKYLGKTAKETAKEQPHLAIRMLSDIGQQSRGEAFQELTQEELAILHEAWTATPEEYAAHDHWSRENWLRRGEAAAGGALIGVPGGVASSAIPTTTSIKEKPADLSPLIGLIEEGLSAGELDGEPFTPEIAKVMMDEAYADKVLTVEDVALLQERFPDELGTSFMPEEDAPIEPVEPEGPTDGPGTGKSAPFIPGEKTYYDTPEGKYSHLQKPARPEEPGISGKDAAEFEEEVREEQREAGEFGKIREAAKRHVKEKNKPAEQSVSEQADTRYKEITAKKGRKSKADSEFVTHYEKVQKRQAEMQDEIDAFNTAYDEETIESKPVKDKIPEVPTKPEVIPGAQEVEDVAGSEVGDEKVNPWEISRKEYLKTNPEGLTGDPNLLGRRLGDKHENLVREAYERGETIPGKVLKDYPALTKVGDEEVGLDSAMVAAMARATEEAQKKEAKRLGISDEELHKRNVAEQKRIDDARETKKRTDILLREQIAEAKEDIEDSKETIKDWSARKYKKTKLKYGKKDEFGEYSETGLVQEANERRRHGIIRRAQRNIEQQKELIVKLEAMISEKPETTEARLAEDIKKERDDFVDFLTEPTAKEATPADILTKALPDKDIKADRPAAQVPGGKPFYSFTPKSGKYKGNTFSTNTLTEKGVREAYDKMVERFDKSVVEPIKEPTPKPKPDPALKNIKIKTKSYPREITKQTEKGLEATPDKAKGLLKVFNKTEALESENAQEALTRIDEEIEQMRKVLECVT